MHDITLLIFKSVTHIVFSICLLITQAKTLPICLLAAVICISNPALSIFIYKMEVVFKERYTRKMYKMPKKYHLIFSVLEIITLILFYFLEFSENKWSFPLVGAAASHFTFIFLFSYFLISTKKKIIKERKVLKKTFEHGTMKASVEIRGAVVVEQGEKVQIVDRFNGHITIRKSNGDEYSIDANMIQEL